MQMNLQELVLTSTRLHSHTVICCSPQVCEFVKNGLDIDIQSHKTKPSKVVFTDDQELINEKYYCNETVKLFYQNHIRYSCYSQNWGKSKGQDHYEDVCIALYKKAKEAFDLDQLSLVSSSSRNKLYVACTRANGDIYFIDEKNLGKFRS